MNLSELFSVCFRAPANKIHRDFDPPYFLEAGFQEFYNRHGFVVIRDCITEENIRRMTEVYEQLSRMEGFTLQDFFVNSGRFASTDIRNFIVTEIKKSASEILTRIARTDNCEINTGGSFQIKPSSKNSALNPHQDSPIIDESTHYATYVWIPLCDMHEENGALSVLPGSHLWGNHQRSLNVPWIYEKHTSLLWKYMQPVYVCKGDVVCFDSAIIHASGPNLSGQLRLAYTTILLPRNFQLVHYFRDSKTPAGKVEKYAVDEYFYSNCDILRRPEPPYRLLDLEDWVGQVKVSRRQILSLISNHPMPS